VEFPFVWKRVPEHRDTLLTEALLLQLTRNRLSVYSSIPQSSALMCPVCNSSCRWKLKRISPRYCGRRCLVRTVRLYT